MRVLKRNSFTNWDQRALVRCHAKDITRHAARTEAIYEECIPSNDVFEKKLGLAGKFHWSRACVSSERKGLGKRFFFLPLVLKWLIGYMAPSYSYEGFPA
ncbi:hypothetical protein TNCV_545951 [Trichonephila clavipes]|nr:hypothetical protein TNCV_545951 [Trichonephila clavipes]